MGEENFWSCTLRECSKLFGVEVWCCSADIENVCYDDFEPTEYYEHYANGEEADGEPPAFLSIFC